MISPTLKKRGGQLASYGMIGVLATAAHYLVMATLYTQGFSPLVATSFGASLGALVAYIANRKWTFQASNTTARMIRFGLVALLGLVLNGILLVTIQHWLISSITGAQLLTTGLVFVATYFFNLKWSFL